ncbi:hypothetical protein [Magnetospirillum sp. 15-1]|uniref:hypothetical protein n=1 Tax=Magnetospirillum sp. 15-1 TaxID=1979370 RepID=UPI001142FDBB|nr:hypothetical protein [Magnetospirillum sp. 15-1]
MLSCLGLSLEGCAYDPANAANVYFTLGDVVAALGVTLIVPQFLKPIYLLRLKVRRISLITIYALVFAGTLPIAMAALLPQFPIPRVAIIGHPLFWEFLGTLLFVTAYAFLAFGSLAPITIREGAVERFVRAGAALLAEGNERDCVDFAGDLARNLPTLIRVANFIGDGREFSAFMEFRCRAKIKDGRYAASFLGIISDHKFCASLVTFSPWLAADIMNSLARERLNSRHAERFVQELALQTILLDQSMMSREVGYGGFSVAPVLSESLFGDHFIAQTYEPFAGIRFGSLGTPTRAMMMRLNAAAELSLKAALEESSYWSGRNFSHLQDVYEHVFRELSKMKRANNLEVGLSIEADSGVDALIKITRNHLATLTADRIYDLYRRGADCYGRGNIIEAVAELTSKSLETIANSFEGVNDPFWSHVSGTLHTLFPFYEDEPAGMDPLQQRVALKIVAKLKENMEGWFPAMSRVMLAGIGPYGNFRNIKNRSAYVILVDAVYYELQRLSKLAAENPYKLSDFLPETTEYDTEANALIHTYADGAESTTKLADIQPLPFSFAPPEDTGEVGAGH